MHNEKEGVRDKVLGVPVEWQFLFYDLGAYHRYSRNQDSEAVKT